MSLGKLLTAGQSLVGLHNSAARYQLRTGALPKFESQKNPFASRPQNEEPSSKADQLTATEMAAATLKDTQRLPLLILKPDTNGKGVEPAQPGEDRTRPETSSASPGSVGKGWDEVVLGIPGGGPASAADAHRGGEPLDHQSVSIAPQLHGKQDIHRDAPETPNMSEVPSAINGWLKKLNPLVWWENRKPAQPKSAISRFDRAPVQGELSLDNIKVVRNDLSDADVEIVPMKARPAKPPPAPTLGTGAGAAAAAMAIPELPPAKNAWEFLGERLLGKH